MIRTIAAFFFTPSTAKALSAFNKATKQLEKVIAHEGHIIAKQHERMSKAERTAEAARIRQKEASRFHAKIEEFLA
ncbi:hypothetical protein V6R85_02410 [Agrobacterium sp. CCNWLW32]|uniref:hypothetical protein n=1 Tax=Agrobacterium sp. CCNWLW32 TaxID=3122072 RepID=UPI000458F32B|nr:hypothetical protein AWN88_25520 [Agrobacterium tumefaciens]KAJ36287.1 hypothetical protein BW45_22905 [Agrobacterium tumefaciens]